MIPGEKAFFRDVDGKWKECHLWSEYPDLKISKVKHGGKLVCCPSKDVLASADFEKSCFPKIKEIHLASQVKDSKVRFNSDEVAKALNVARPVASQFMKSAAMLQII